MRKPSFRLHFIDEDEGTDDTEGWYVVDNEGGALGGPFGSKREATEEGKAILADARRYRHLRDHCVRSWTCGADGQNTTSISLKGEGCDLDATIDAALTPSPAYRPQDGEGV